MKPIWPVQLSSGRGDERARWKAKFRCTRARLLEVIFVEDFLPGTGAVPEADLASGLLGFEQMREMGAQRSHAGAAADIDHFALGGLDMEVAEGTDSGDDVAGLEAEDIAGTDAGSAILPGRWGGDAHIETQHGTRCCDCWPGNSCCAGRAAGCARPGRRRADFSRRWRRAREYRSHGSGWSS